MDWSSMSQRKWIHSKHLNSPRRRRRRKKNIQQKRLNTPAPNDGKLDLIRCLSIFIRVRREASIFDTIYLYISIFLAYTNIKYNPVGNVHVKNLHVFQYICLVRWKSRSFFVYVKAVCITTMWDATMVAKNILFPVNLLIFIYDANMTI